MKSNYFINAVFILVLCVNQIAANIHVVGHFEVDAGRGEHAIDHDTSSHHLHHHNVVDLAATSEKNDCSAYHAFAGMTGLALSNPDSIVCSTNYDQPDRYPPVAFVARPVDADSIRGPPSHS